MGRFGDLARQADGETIGIGGGQSELPVGQSEALLQFFGDENRIFGGQHQRDAALHLLFDGFDGGEGRMPGHGAGVAQAEVDVAVAVHVVEVRALGFADEGRKSAGPLDHPVHGHAAEQRFAGTLEQGLGLGALVHEALSARAA